MYYLSNSYMCELIQFTIKKHNTIFHLQIIVEVLKSYIYCNLKLGL